jgi:hypothetical protein
MSNGLRLLAAAVPQLHRHFVAERGSPLGVVPQRLLAKDPLLILQHLLTRSSCHLLRTLRRALRALSNHPNHSSLAIAAGSELVAAVPVDRCGDLVGCGSHFAAIYCGALHVTQ